MDLNKNNIGPLLSEDIPQVNLTVNNTLGNDGSIIYTDSWNDRATA